MKKVLVFCGSSKGIAPEYEAAAKQLGKLFAANDLGLVYGGGSIGLMGELADAVLENGGNVTGVIPQFLADREVAHMSLTELNIVDDMHQRKQTMFQLCNAVVALPGGLGTLEELVEIMTWAQLSLHKKPIWALNVNGYFELFDQLLGQMVSEGFMSKSSQELVRFESDPEALVRELIKI